MNRVITPEVEPVYYPWVVFQRHVFYLCNLSPTQIHLQYYLYSCKGQLHLLFINQLLLVVITRISVMGKYDLH